MSDKTPDILIAALRQYQHNDCSGFVAGFDYDETVGIVRAIEAQRDELLAALKPILERVRDFEDCGPHGETWQSDELINEINFAYEVIAKCDAQS